MRFILQPELADLDVGSRLWILTCLLKLRVDINKEPGFVQEAYRWCTTGIQRHPTSYSLRMRLDQRTERLEAWPPDRQAVFFLRTFFRALCGSDPSSMGIPRLDTHDGMFLQFVNNVAVLPDALERVNGRHQWSQAGIEHHQAIDTFIEEQCRYLQPQDIPERDQHPILDFLLERSAKPIGRSLLMRVRHAHSLGLDWFHPMQRFVSERVQKIPPHFRENFPEEKEKA